MSTNDTTVTPFGGFAGADFAIDSDEIIPAPVFRPVEGQVFPRSDHVEDQPLPSITPQTLPSDLVRALRIVLVRIASRPDPDLEVLTNILTLLGPHKASLPPEDEDVMELGEDFRHNRRVDRDHVMGRIRGNLSTGQFEVIKTSAREQEERHGHPVIGFLVVVVMAAIVVGVIVLGLKAFVL